MAITHQDRVETLAEAVMKAPSVHNTQPWRLSVDGTTCRLLVDPGRRLDTADPASREMLVSCGAALFNLRLAIRHLGHVPDRRPLPDPADPALVAEVRFGRPTAWPPEAGSDLYEQIDRRHTHRGAFPPDRLPVSLFTALRDAARQEGAALRLIADQRARRALGALTEAAEQLQQLSPEYVAEIARWAPPPNSSRRDGVHPATYPFQTGQTEPNFAGRDFARGMGWGDRGGGHGVLTAGTVAVLTTRDDDRTDWVAAGQALQHVLLAATAAGAAVAFHTQPLEVPELREVIRAQMCDGAHPQMLLRLGMSSAEPASVRRDVNDVLKTPNPA